MHTYGSPSLQISSETVNFCKEIWKETKQTCSFVQEITISFAVVGVGLPGNCSSTIREVKPSLDIWANANAKFVMRMFSEGMDKDEIIKKTKYKSARAQGEALEKGVTLLAPHWL